MEGTLSRLPGIRKTLILMAGSAVIISIAVILHINWLTPSYMLGSNSLVMASLTFFPYMISAAVAAVTSVAMIRIWPLMKIDSDLDELSWRVREMAYGDLSTRIKLNTDNTQIQLLANELNFTISELGRKLAQMKIINRQQWEILEVIRHESVQTSSAQLVDNIEQMQVNWEKMAELEQEIQT